MKAPEVTVRGIGGLGLYKLTPAQTRTLLAMANAKGPAVVRLSAFSKIEIDGVEIGSRDCAVWLRLVALGLIEGSHGRLRLTTYGRRTATSCNGGAS